MANKIFFTEDAFADLENILDYIRADNEAAAEAFGTALLDHIELTSPGSERPFEGAPWFGSYCTPLSAFTNRLQGHDGLIEILHFRHGARIDSRP